MPVVPATSENLDRAAARLREGGVVAFPTETVYGLGANAFDALAVARVFEIKRRPQFDPLIVHVLDEAMLERVASEVSARARALIERFWPGPLTLVLRKRPGIPDLVTADLPTVAVRMPAHAVARALIARAGIPLAAPSANPFGRLSPTRADRVARALGDEVDLIIDGGAAEHGIESTIVALEPEPVLLRPGAIPREAIEAAIGTALLQAPSDDGRPRAPGRLTHHYAPQTPLRLIDPQRVPPGERSRAALVTLSAAPPGYAHVRRLSESSDLREAAARLFETLHELDDLGLERIDAEPVPETGLGVAIMDRLRRAST
ncbi:MAG TPA: L-threonylcarbamoyladenylate synthase [Candidatus Tumulicola sp.]|jgi:L-threonylcarbamoyladenylate synthase